MSAITKEEARRQFMDKVRQTRDYWLNESRADSAERKLDGLIFSLLCIFDGCTDLPAFDIVARPHEDDKEYRESKGTDWWEDGMAINDDTHLHEIYYTPASPAKER